MIELNFSFLPLRIDKFPTFNEKMDAVTLYLYIDTVFCESENKKDLDPQIEEKYFVNNIIIRPGQPTYIKSILQSILLPLKQSLEEFVSSELDHYTITKTLQNIKEKCEIWSKKYDIHKSLPYYQNEVSYILCNKDKWPRMYIESITFSQDVSTEIKDHYAIRKEFFEEMIGILNKQLEDHNEIMPYPRKPYYWQSENPHLEIAELLFALIQSRIKIKKGEKGSTAKLTKEFYNLFGLDEAQYHQRLQSIRRRSVENKSWLYKLPTIIEDLQKKSESNKNDS